jgi:putative serine protease PepD
MANDQTGVGGSPRWRRSLTLGSAAAVAGVVLVGCGSSGPSASAPCDVISLATDVLPSVVTISASAPGGGAAGTGSGEVIRSDGYILTNNHVISQAANGGSVSVLFSGGESVPATITGRDPQTDLAVLKVTPPHALPVIKVGTSDSVQVGQPVVALGAPLGLSGTVTSGIVSQLDRTVQVPGEDDRHALLVSAIQTDAAINPGNSGGALVNCGGQLVGVPTAGAQVPGPAAAGGSIGLGFAIPVDLAERIADEIISTGTVTHAYFGLQTVPIPASAAQQEGLPEGLFVNGVAPAGPAAQAGIRVGDVITQVEGEPAASNLQFEELSLTKQPGDEVGVTYSRAGHSATANITLGST